MIWIVKREERSGCSKAVSRGRLEWSIGSVSFYRYSLHGPRVALLSYRLRWRGWSMQGRCYLGEELLILAKLAQCFRATWCGKRQLKLKSRVRKGKRQVQLAVLERRSLKWKSLPSISGRLLFAKNSERIKRKKATWCGRNRIDTTPCQLWLSLVIRMRVRRLLWTCAVGLSWIQRTVCFRHSILRSAR